MRVLIFGDSITQGFFDSQGGWAGRLAGHYHQKILDDLAGKWTEFFNLGVDADTAADVLKRIGPETEARQGKNEALVIVIAIGMNDSVLRQNEVEQEIYEFQETYEEIIAQAQKFTEHVLCIGLTAVDEKLTNPWKYSQDGVQVLNNRLNLFEDTIKQSAIRNKLTFVPVHDAFLRALENGQDLLAEGVHPNDSGHKMIAELVRPVLDDLIVK